MLGFPKWNLSALWEARNSLLTKVREEKKEGSQWPMRESCPLNRGNLFLIVKRVISFFLCSRHTCPEANGKTLWVVMGETHRWRWKWTSIFFGVQTPRDTGISARVKKHLHLWEHVPNVRVALRNRPFLTRRVMSISDPKQLGMLFFGTHVLLKGWNQ